MRGAQGLIVMGKNRWPYFVLLLLFLPLFLWGQLASGKTYRTLGGLYNGWSFDGDKYQFYAMGDPFLSRERGVWRYVESGIYTLTRDQVLTWISFIPSQIAGGTRTEELRFPNRPLFSQLLVIASEDAAQFYGIEEGFVLSCWAHFSRYEPIGLFRLESTDSSSSLMTQKGSYSAENLQFYPELERPTPTPKRPWIEGADGNGVGEWVELDFKGRFYVVDTILFANGYIDPLNIDRYLENGRVKRIKISSASDSRLNLTFDLKDTPEIQKIPLPIVAEEEDFTKEMADNQEVVTTTLRFEILEVYPGSSSDTTAINFIGGMNQKAVDYQKRRESILKLEF